MTGFDNTCTLSDYADCLTIETINHKNDNKNDRSRSTITIYLGDYRSAMSWQLLQDAKVTAVCNCTCTVPNLFPQRLDYCHVNIADTTTVTTESTTATTTATTTTASTTTTDSSSSSSSTMSSSSSSSSSSHSVVVQQLWDIATTFLHHHDCTLVHCHAGRSRSVAVVVAYLIRYHGYTRNDALSWVRHHRQQQQQHHRHHRPRCNNNNENNDGTTTTMKRTTHIATTAPNPALMRQLTLYQYRYHTTVALSSSAALSPSTAATILSQYYTIEWAQELCRTYYDQWYCTTGGAIVTNNTTTTTPTTTTTTTTTTPTIRMDDKEQHVMMMPDVCAQHAQYILPVMLSVLVATATAEMDHIAAAVEQCDGRAVASTSTTTTTLFSSSAFSGRRRRCRIAIPAVLQWCHAVLTTLRVSSSSGVAGGVTTSNDHHHYGMGVSP